MYAFVIKKLFCILISPALLLTISFFVLVTLTKVDSKNIKTFGKGVVVLLCGIAALLFLTGIYATSLGVCSFKGEKICTLGDYKVDPHHGLNWDPHHQGMMQGDKETTINLR
jgi:hypothetical protein